MKKIIQAAGCTVFSVAVLLGLLSGIILSVGGNAGYMHTMFLRHANTGITGVDVQEYPDLADKITGYLLGKTDTFQTTLTVHGYIREAFSEKELLHMADVQHLFTLCRTLLIACTAIAVLWLVSSSLWFKPLLAASMRAYVRTSLCIAVLGVILAIWAAIDFHSLFTQFHHVFFTNDLWLLNPSEDLLLQLMPTGFFIDYAARIGLLWLAGGLILVLAALLYLKKRRQGHVL